MPESRVEKEVEKKEGKIAHELREQLELRKKALEDYKAYLRNVTPGWDRQLLDGEVAFIDWVLNFLSQHES